MAWPLYDILRARTSDTPESRDPLDLFLEYVLSKNLDLYPAQEEAILELYSGKNVILNTPTGSWPPRFIFILFFAGAALSTPARSKPW